MPASWFERVKGEGGMVRLSTVWMLGGVFSKWGFSSVAAIIGPGVSAWAPTRGDDRCEKEQGCKTTAFAAWSGVADAD